MTTYQFKKNEYSFNEIATIVKKENKEVPSFNKPYTTNIINKLDKLKDYEHIFCLSSIIEDVECFIYFKRNERTGKSSLIKNELFTRAIERN